MALQRTGEPSLALVPTGTSTELPVGTRALLGGLTPERVTELEIRYGNGDLIRTLDALGIAGPLRVLSPWELEDPSGRHLIAAGSYAALPFGESYGPLVEFIGQFLEHNRSVALPNQSASEWRAALEAALVTLLAREAPSHADSQVFFSNSGAEAIEAAIKFAKAARAGKHIVAFQRGYHGKTTGALSLTPNEEYQAPFRPLMPGVTILPYGDAQALEDGIRDLGPDRVSAIVLEPIQGEGGVVRPPADFLPAVERLRRQHGILVIADEIQTGLGRCGHLFASVAGGLDPDIVTLAKPLGGGLVPVGATITRKWIVKATLGGIESKRHSNTFGGGSLAMAVGLKSLEIILEERLAERAQSLGERGLARLREMKERHPGVIRDVRGAGMLFALVLQPLVTPRAFSSRLFGSRMDEYMEVARQLGSALALRELHLGGVHACYTQNSSQIVRLTPALNMPEAIFETMFDRVDGVAGTLRSSWRMIPRTPPNRLLGLAKLAFGS